MDKKTDAPLVLSVAGFVLLVYGFLHSKYYYSTFGLRVQDFFSIEDYLRANIENIYSVFAPLCIGFGYKLFLDYYEISRRSRDVSPEDAERASLYWATWTHLIMGTASLVLGMYWTFVDRSPRRYFFLVFFCVMLWFQFEYRFLRLGMLREFVKNHFLLYFSLAIWVPLSFAILYGNAKYGASLIIESESSGLVQIVFEENFREGRALDAKELFLVGSNSAYFFLYDRSDSSTHVVPSRWIKDVVVGKEASTQPPSSSDSCASEELSAPRGRELGPQPDTTEIPGEADT